MMTVVLFLCLLQYDDCSFVLWGMSDSKDSTDYDKTVKKMLENVNKYFKKWIDRLEGSIRTAIQYVYNIFITV